MKKYFRNNMGYKAVLIILFFSSLIDKIPAQVLQSKDTSNIQFINSRKFYIYKVDKGETLFGISQKFKIPQEEIVQFNHDIEKSGLKAKMKLWIPAYSWIKKDSVAVKEIEEVKPGNVTYKIAVVTFLDIPKTYTAVDTSDTYVDEPIRKEVRENLEFIEGIIRSAEILKSEGLKAHLYFIDSENDSLKLVNKLNKNTGYNLIITNENGNILKCLSKYSQSKDIKLFSTGMNTFETIKENKNAFSLMPSSGRQCEEMGKFSGLYFHNANLITIKTTASKENERSEFFRSGWKKHQEKSPTLIDFSSGGSEAVADCLDKKYTNVVFISSSNEDFVSSILTAIGNKVPEYDVKVLGLPTWQYFETIDQKLIEKCNVYVFNSGFVDYNSDTVLSLRKYFRDKYYTEPTDITYQGYDAFLAAGKSLLMNGKKFYNEENHTEIKGIYSNYIFVRSGSESAFENKIIHVFQPAGDSSIDLTRESSKMK